MLLLLLLQILLSVQQCYKRRRVKDQWGYIYLYSFILNPQDDPSFIIVIIISHCYYNVHYHKVC